MTFSTEPTHHAYVRVTDMKNHTVNLSDLKYIDETVFTEIKNYTIAKNDLYITIAGTIGAVGEFPDELDGMNLTENAVKVSAIGINKSFLCFIMQTEFVQKQFKHKTYQVAMPKLGLERILTTLIPVCGIVTQQKICDAIQNSTKYIDIIGENYSGLSDTIAVIKSKILDLAIRGKLVPQNPDDEPASALLERIRAEKEVLIKQGKIKRDKKESIIFKGEDNSYYEKFDSGDIKCIDEDVPFELPDSWCWCRLGTLFAHNTGKALNSSDTAGTLMTYITTSNLYWDRFELDSLKEMPFTESEIEKCTVTKGDLLVCEGGDIGRSAIWMHNEDIRIQNHIHRLRPYISLSNRFFYYVLFMWKQTGRIGGQGIGLQGFSSKALHNLIVPLPPLSEQLHIVAYVDELNQKLSDIEKGLS